MTYIFPVLLDLHSPVYVYATDPFFLCYLEYIPCFAYFTDPFFLDYLAYIPCFYHYIDIIPSWIIACETTAPLWVWNDLGVNRPAPDYLAYIFCFISILSLFLGLFSVYFLFLSLFYRYHSMITGVL